MVHHPVSGHTLLSLGTELAEFLLASHQQVLYSSEWHPGSGFNKLEPHKQFSPRMKLKKVRINNTQLTSLIALCSLGFSLLAQDQPPVAPEAAPAPAAAGPGAGRGGRGGLGRGGGQAQDRFAGADLSPKAPVKPLSVAEQQKKFILQPGFKLEPILTEPDIKEPAAIAFDGNGRMFVLELRAYMQDADSSGELDPTCRISLHEDRNNDGKYETHHVFVDGLVFPRFVMPFGANAILTMESNQDEVWKFTDTNNDGKADKKELFATGFGRAGNVEHQQAFLTWGMDNWMYSTYNAFRARWTPTGVIKEPTGSNGAQWGVTQDNYGKIWFQTGANGVPANFQFPIHYGNFNYPQQFEPGFRIPWGAPTLLEDFEPGTSVIRRPDGSLNDVTGSAGNDIFRGNRLPKDMIGDLFHGEPVARIVRQVHPVNMEGMTQARNAYPYNEFIKSLDPLFRPVDVATAPDGTLYIADMYRGIIQEGNWTRPGSYLRAKVDQYQLGGIIGRGRIWRVTYQGMPRSLEQPRMLNETPAQLVTRLAHPNGWWRDTAQQLLILKQNKSVVPALKAMALNSTNELARIHALWTLEGLDSLDPLTARKFIADKNPNLRIQGIRVSETLFKAGNKSFLADYTNATKDSNTDVAIQGMLTMKLFGGAATAPTLTAAMAANKAQGVQLVGEQILRPPQGGRGGGPGAPQMTQAQRDLMASGELVFKELCFTCHGPDGRGMQREGAAPGVTMAPSYVGSPRVNGHRDYVIKAIMNGLKGPIDGDNFLEEMVPMGTNKDEWIAGAASYIRNSFGNNAGFVTVADVARVRAENKRALRQTEGPGSKDERWTVPELVAATPSLLPYEQGWKATASHNNAGANGAFGFVAWTTAAPQQPGMWFQVELPNPATICELQFESNLGTSPTASGIPGVPLGPVAGARGPQGQPAQPPQAPAPGAAPPQPAGRGGFGGRGGGAGAGFPRGYKVEVSTNGTTWTQIAEGKGEGSAHTITFNPVQAKFIKITQTGTEQNAPAWNIQRLRMYQPGKQQVASR